MQDPVLDNLLQGVVSYFAPQRIILFGSRGRGTPHPDSDYDLLVVVDDDTPPQKLTLEAGFESRRNFTEAADIIPCRAVTFQKRSAVVGTLCHIAKTEGRTVYERNR